MLMAYLKREQCTLSKENMQICLNILNIYSEIYIYRNINIRDISQYIEKTATMKHKHEFIEIVREQDMLACVFNKSLI